MTTVEWDPYYLKIIFEKNRGLAITNTAYFLATVNLVLNEYPDLLKEQPEYREFMIDTTKELLDYNVKMSDWVKKKAKQSIRHLENVEQGKRLIRLWKR